MSAPASRTNGRSAGGQPSGERDEQPGLAHAAHERGERGRLHQVPQPGPVLVRRVEQQSFCAGARRLGHERKRRDAGGAIRIRKRDGHHTAVSRAAGPRAAHRGLRQDADAFAARDARKPDLDEPRAGLSELAGGALDGVFVRGVSERRGHRARAGHGGDDGAELVGRHGRERSAHRVFRVDQVGAPRQGRRRIRRVRHADQQPHRALLYHLVIWSSGHLVISVPLSK